jgi:hypothetical protein
MIIFDLRFAIKEFGEAQLLKNKLDELVFTFRK